MIFIDGMSMSCSKAADFFRVFGDENRIRILFALLREKELCVSEIADRLEMGQSAVSHQLRILRQADLVWSRREGKNILYALDDGHVEAILRTGLEHLDHKEREK